MARYWYQYKGFGDDGVPGSYFAPISTKPGCTGGSVACAIYVGSGGASPDYGAITDNIISYLTIAKQNSYAYYPLVDHDHPFVDPEFVGTRT